MDDDILWQLFADTGDPLSWLMYRAGTEGRENEEPKDEDRPQTLG